MTVGIACSATNVAAFGCVVQRAVWCAQTVNQTLRKSSVFSAAESARGLWMMADWFVAD